MEKSLVIIEILGGGVHKVKTNIEDLEYLVIDHDELEKQAASVKEQINIYMEPSEVDRRDYLLGDLEYDLTCEYGS